MATLYIIGAIALIALIIWACIVIEGFADILTTMLLIDLITGIFENQ